EPRRREHQHHPRGGARQAHSRERGLPTHRLHARPHQRRPLDRPRRAPQQRGRPGEGSPPLRPAGRRHRGRAGPHPTTGDTASVWPLLEPFSGPVGLVVPRRRLQV
ncbi:MAG: hypothetical protein AVDCRST_MAG03-2335, partial [uncultured Rubrobacteraceae bacterium]